jgi:16S rRNA (cytosine967-C5)-methyltransferase
MILGADVEALSPAWLAAECPEAARAPMRDVLLSRAPLWLRLQGPDPAAALSEFDRLGWAWRRSPLLAGAVELPAGADVVKTKAYLGGVRPGGQWLDACAGAGGKALQLAVMLGAAGSVTARDPRRAALEQLAARATRAGLEGRIRIGSGAEPRHGYDGVLVDAPCSGSGTWRRAPHLRWVTSPSSLRAAAALQRRLLQENAPRVRAGGLLVYATCSLCRSENESVAEAFLSGNPGFVPEIVGRRLEPQAHDGDGFFVASFRRTLAGGPLSSRP